MLESLTIFDKGGFVLYQFVNQDAVEANDGNNDSALLLNQWLGDIYLNPTVSNESRRTALSHSDRRRVVVEWEETKDLLAAAIYPDVRGQKDSFSWVRELVQATLLEYQLFASSSASPATEGDENEDPLRHNTSLFDNTFQVLLSKHKGKNTYSYAASNNSKQGSSSRRNVQQGNNNPGKGGKAKRQWHDGKAKVTKEAMAELDRSKPSDAHDGADGGGIDNPNERALAEARAAYLPTDADLAEYSIQPISKPLDDTEEDESSENSWGKSLNSLFQQVTGQKVLTKADLQAPLTELHKMLTSKNVASDIAQKMCDNVEQQLVNKRLNSMYRVKTAVRQALERVISKLLAPSVELDLLRQVISKRDGGGGWNLIGGSSRNSTRRPFVIVVVGINGVGKSTSLAKIAFYLKSNGCNPLLAACDTFRSGAVEQLGVHAKCLGVPLYHKGYAKDPSLVAKAAIEQATEDGHDVVLVDTAGRMQNNVPLMKALGKLAHENNPDMVVFVGEALVGNDGVDQVRMFHQAVSSVNRAHKVNAIMLTKFDTVSDKVGAALTMTHVTNAPILFVGTGQKYHHLQKLSTESVLKSLFR